MLRRTWVMTDDGVVNDDEQVSLPNTKDIDDFQVSPTSKAVCTLKGQTVKCFSGHPSYEEVKEYSLDNKALELSVGSLGFCARSEKTIRCEKFATVNYLPLELSIPEPLIEPQLISFGNIDTEVDSYLDVTDVPISVCVSSAKNKDVRCFGPGIRPTDIGKIADTRHFSATSITLSSGCSA